MNVREEGDGHCVRSNELTHTVAITQAYSCPTVLTLTSDCKGKYI